MCIKKYIQKYIQPFENIFDYFITLHRNMLTCICGHCIDLWQIDVNRNSRKLNAAKQIVPDYSRYALNTSNAAECRQLQWPATFSALRNQSWQESRFRLIAECYRNPGPVFPAISLSDSNTIERRCLYRRLRSSCREYLTARSRCRFKPRFCLLRAQVESRDSRSIHQASSNQPDRRASADRHLLATDGERRKDDERGNERTDAPTNERRRENTEKRSLLSRSRPRKTSLVFDFLW